ncbi:MAG: inositol monophosphatase family protein [Streptosporangiaceae bacterium]
MNREPGALMNAACQAMDIAAQMALSRKPEVTAKKGDRDMVSDLDIAIERTVRDFLADATPGIGFLGEEEGATGAEAGLRWALDPIDGTANFVAGIPLFAVSLALIDDQQSLIGVVDVPVLGERYTAIQGGGAMLNGEPIAVREVHDLSDAIVATGDYAVSDDAAATNPLRLAITRQLARQVQRVRMVGSAAIDLTWVAAGRLDASIMLSNKPWDTAAGVIIAREAGAAVVDSDGNQHSLGSASTIAVPSSLLPKILKLIREA